MKTLIGVLIALMFPLAVAAAQPPRRRDAARHGRRSERRGDRRRARDAVTAAIRATASTRVETGDARRRDVHGARAGPLHDSRRVARLRAVRRARRPAARRRQPARGEADDREVRRDGAGRPRSARARRAIRAATRSPRCSTRRRSTSCRTIPTRWSRCCATWPAPASVLRVNGFRGGRLPPKGQIQQIRFRRNMFAADTHEPGFVSIDITTKPGIDNWRGSTNLGFRDAALSARNAFAPVKGDEQHERYGVQPERTALEEAHVAVALGRRHRRVRHQDDRRGAAVRAISPTRSASRTTR